jgi:hypothetical protein
MGLSPVQRKAAVDNEVVQRREGGAQSADNVQETAATGVSGAGTTLPHLDLIQRAFGRHDVSGVQAHVGGPAATASDAIGANAYATGSHAAFRESPDLHTVAHEAAHVVQQRGGVQLKGGVGEAGDRYEQHADAVADRVVRGESAEGMLDEMAGSSTASPSAHGPVQRKEGTITHQGNVGSGSVTARENDEDTSKKRNDFYTLEYAGADADKAHWLQFVNFSMYADEPGTGRVYYTGDVQTSSGKKPFSTDKVTNWSVDSASTSDPYYEAGFINSRTPGKTTKMFDAPGGKSIEPFAAQFASTKAPKATKVVFSASFDTYLVQNNKTTYHVRWSATTKYDVATKASAAIDYHTGAGGAAAGLPKDLKKILDSQYSGNKIT